jgi:mono/diheme cytochrome c family protein
MTRIPRAFALSWLAAVMTVGARADEAALQAGRQIAVERCRSCHQVAPDLDSDTDAAAPSFMEIANLPGRGTDYLDRFMRARHMVITVGTPPQPMPTIQLSSLERARVVAYILGFQLDPATARQPPTRIEPFQ